MPDQIIIQRLSSIEAKFDSHQDNDNRIFSKLEEMHKLHFEDSKIQGELLAKLMTEIKNINSTIVNNVENLQRQDNNTNAELKIHLNDHKNFYAWAIVSLLGVIGTSFLIYFQYYIKK